MASAQADQWRRLAGTFRRTFNFPITARQDWEAPLEFDISFMRISSRYEWLLKVISPGKNMWNIDVQSRI